VTFDHDPRRPYDVVLAEVLADAGDVALRRDRLRWPDGTESSYGVLVAPDAAFMVPVDDDGTTVLVRQWRHSWGCTSWEVPAGRLARGEDPLAGAQRELVEEVGLEADEWTSLGITRGTAMTAARQHLFLARRLRRVARSPEASEQDMVLRELPLAEAVEAGLSGEIVHAASIVALIRAARAC